MASHDSLPHHTHGSVSCRWLAVTRAGLAGLLILALLGALIFILLSGISLAQNKVVVIPLIDDGITCSGTLVGTRWCDNGDQTVTDMTTGLVWLKFADWGASRPWRSDTPGDHNDAHTRAGVLEDGNVVHFGMPFNTVLSDGSVAGDWRLPTMTELSNLANGTEAVRDNHMRAFIGVHNNHYWTSSTEATSTNRAWVVSLFNGYTYSSTKNVSYYVWPVRIK